MNKLDLKYQKADSTHIEDIASLKVKQSLYCCNREGLPPFNEDKLRKRISSVLSKELNKTIFFFVAIDEKINKVIACNGIVIYQKVPSNSNFSGKEAYVTSVYTEEEYRKRGIQNILMEQVLAFLQQEEISKIELDAVNPHAIKLYEKFGFMKIDSKYIYQRKN